MNAPYRVSVLARLTLVDLDSGFEGAEGAERDETPRSMYDGPSTTAWVMPCQTGSLRRIARRLSHSELSRPWILAPERRSFRQPTSLSCVWLQPWQSSAVCARRHLSKRGVPHCLAVLRSLYTYICMHVYIYIYIYIYILCIASRVRSDRHPASEAKRRVGVCTTSGKIKRNLLHEL